MTRPREFESNEIFDTPDRKLRSRGELLRVRTSGGRALLTFKAAALPGPHKSREELETPIGDPQTIRGILARLGMQLLFRYEKYRSEYQRPNETGLVTIDETPIGTFMELEGSPTWIDRLAAELGFSSADYILASYGGLYLEHCETHGYSPSHMVFGHEIA